MGAVQADVAPKEFGAEHAVRDTGVNESLGNGTTGVMRLAGVRLRSGGRMGSMSSVMCIREESVWCRTGSASLICRDGDAEKSDLTENISAIVKHGKNETRRYFGRGERAGGSRGRGARAGGEERRRA